MAIPESDTPRRTQPTAKSVFSEAVDLPPESRAEFLDHVCAGNAALRAMAEQLLRVHDGGGPFLRSPTLETAQRAADSTPVAGHSILEAAHDPLVGARVGAYKLLERIGEGGFGAVYLAEQREPVQRKVAVKLIKPGLDFHQAIARFEAERQALALMDHPHIARVFDGGVTDAAIGAWPYFVMEYVKGDPVTSFADAHKLKVRERLDLFIQVCQAVQHAHTKGIIHRDLKPRNVMVSMVDGKPFAKVIDFGVAKSSGSRLTDKTLFTEHRQLIGTLEYMSPEQAEGSPDIDTRTDVYALGVLLYELLSGATPFDAKRLRSAAFAEMQRIIKEEEPPLPSQRLARDLATLAVAAAARQSDSVKLGTLIRGELDWIIMRALEKNRARRYESASQLAADVQRHLSGEPVVAAPPSVAYRVSKFVRKHRGPVIAAGLLATTLVLGIVGTSLGLSAAREQRDAAVGAQRAAVAASAETERQRAAAEQSAYAANVASAAMALERVDTNELRARLEACPQRLRGFEWRLLKALSDQADVVLRGHTDVAWIIRFHPNGEQVATGSKDGTVRLWDASSGACKAVLADLHSVVHSLAYCDDGSRVAAAAESGLACVWDTATGQLVARLRGHTVGPAGWIAFAPGSRRLVTTAEDATTRLWNGDTGEQLWMLQHSAPAKRALFSPDGSLILTTCDDEARIWEVSSGEPRARLEGVSELLQAPAFRPDGQRIIGTLFRGVFEWDTTNGVRFEHPTGLSMRFGTYLPDGQKLWADPGTCLVQLHSGTQHVRCGWEDTLHPIVVHASPRLLVATGSWDDSARIWDAEQDTGPFRTLIGHARRVTQIRFAPNGERVATAAWDNEPRIWSVQADTGVVPESDESGSSWPPAQTHDGALLATMSGSGPVKIWDSRTGQVTAELRGHTGRGQFAEFSHDDRQLLTAADDATVRIWEVSSGRQVTLLSGHHGVSRARFSPDDTSVFSASSSGTGRVWSLNDGQFVELVGHADSLTDCVFSPDGRHVASASVDGTARIWYAKTGKEFAVLRGHPAPVRVVRFSPDGRLIATGGDDGAVRVWDASNGREIHAWPGLAGGVSTINFSADGRRMLATTFAGNAKLWNIESGVEIATLTGHRDSIPCADISPDGSRIVTGSYDGTVRFWDSSNGTCLLTLRVDRFRVDRVAFDPAGTKLFTVGVSQGSRIWDCVPRREQVKRE